MGNTYDTGFHKPPESYCREVRKSLNQKYKEQSLNKSRRESVLAKKEPEKETSTEKLTEESVRKFVIGNPAFLDDLVKNHVSQDRIQAWVQESNREGRAMSENDPDFIANKIMEKNVRHQQNLRITRSRLLYPRKYKRDELKELIERPYSEKYEVEIGSHLFPYTQIPPEDLNSVFILMANKLLGKHAFPMPELCYFLSTLKSNYNNIDYHNYHHALSHAQTMYWILKQNPGKFTEKEMKCLLIAAISHDVGHSGVTDSYLKKTGGGLESLYLSPILEHHHVQTTFLILQDINCNVFCNLEGEDYKDVLNEIQHNILSTSLNRYKVQCENMRHIIATDLNFSKKQVRDAMKSVMMMTSDLCACWKKWDEHKSTVWTIYKEFFLQGDKEESLHLESIPQMVRENADKIPQYQVFFTENICLPVFQIAAKAFPNISPIVENAMENLELWKTYF